MDLLDLVPFLYLLVVMENIMICHAECWFGQSSHGEGKGPWGKGYFCADPQMHIVD